MTNIYIAVYVAALFHLVEERDKARRWAAEAAKNGYSNASKFEEGAREADYEVFQYLQVVVNLGMAREGELAERISKLCEEYGIVVPPDVF